MTLIEEIYAVVLPLMTKYGIEDTPENRIEALEAFAESWGMFPNHRAIGYRMAVQAEVSMLKLKAQFPEVFKRLDR